MLVYYYVGNCNRDRYVSSVLRDNYMLLLKIMILNTVRYVTIASIHDVVRVFSMYYHC